MKVLKFIIILLLVTLVDKLESYTNIESLYAPWRESYVVKPYKDCPFCSQFNEDNDKDNFILKRFKSCVVICNLYPYTKGHLLVIPNKHVDNITKLDKIERSELFEAVNACISILEEQLKPIGFNVGINLKSKYAGSSIPKHVHIHIIPRFASDTGSIQLISKTALISYDPNKLYDKLKKEFDKIEV